MVPQGSTPPPPPQAASTSTPTVPPHSPSPEPATHQPTLSSQSPHHGYIPRPRSRSEESLQKIRIKNRRKLYLDRHPSYFTSPDLELADPLLYDRCIRRFQTASEREADGKAKGYSGVLEADLYRTEAKILALHPPSPSSAPSMFPKPASEQNFVPFVSYQRGKDGQVLPEEEDEVPKTRQEGWERWVFGMTVRFLKGEDGEFEYGVVDGAVGEEDEVERREREEEWFEGESSGEVEGDGETGIQDF
ncbi:hypothetical protein LZ554_008977 [Drepanopeziza brunnea f. sp. 'monogermtubi']|nr:hypothetical protein LZ554_008977 [Drepanopeziza brunnea f. sp. 'monogermtubi']